MRISSSMILVQSSEDIAEVSGINPHDSGIEMIDLEKIVRSAVQCLPSLSNDNASPEGI